MKRIWLNIPTFVAVLLIPFIGGLRVVCNVSGPHSDQDMQIVSSKILLYFAFLTIFVSIYNFIMAHRAWKQNNEKCMNLTYLAHGYNIVFAVAISIMAALPSFRDPLVIILVLLVWLFPIGLVLMILGLVGFWQRKYYLSRKYLVVTFIAAAVFFPVIPVFFLLLVTGSISISMCYCPVNRRSLKRDFILRPFYSYRRRKLAERLMI